MVEEDSNKWCLGGYLSENRPVVADSSTGNPWNVSTVQKSAEKISLSSIMAHQEKEERQISSLDEEDVGEEILSQIKAMETEEERMIRLAVEASLQDSTAILNTRSSSLQDFDINDSAASIDIVDDIALAIKLSLNDRNCKSTLVPEEQLINFSTTDEEESIARALREADDMEAALSLKLAIELQAEEDRYYYQAQVDKVKSNASKSNIIVLTRAELEKEQSKCVYDAEHMERKVYSHRDYYVHDFDHKIDMRFQEREENEMKSQALSGFQINSSEPSRWSRLDKNTIIKDNEVRTKHDVSLKNQTNAEKLLGSTYTLAKKDGDLSVNDKAFNSYNQSMKNVMKRSMVKGVERSGTGRAENMSDKTRGGAMDTNVRLLISKAINNGLIKHCNGVVNEGKEAIVYHAEAGFESQGFDVAVKVFKRISEFRNRSSYIDNDPRYHGQKFRNADSREQVELWAEKEYRNLMRANLAGVSVPTPLLQKENVLFLRFLGDSGWPAPQLREIELRKGSEKWSVFYCQILVSIRRLFHCARLVHGDLSEYNILVCSSSQVENSYFGKDEDESGENDSNLLQIVVIDFGQAVERNHPSSSELLKRDLKIITEFFLKQDIATLTIDECEEFVTRACVDIKSDQDDESLSPDEPDSASWRHTPKTWSDKRDLHWLHDRLHGIRISTLASDDM